MDFDDIRQAITRGTARQHVPGWAQHVLRAVAAGRGPMAPVRHPQGFVCVPVARTGHRGVCVHVWSNRLRRAPLTTSAIHSHSWDLMSYVLYGAVRNQLVTVTDASDDATHRLFEIHNSPRGDQLRRTARLVRYEISATEFCLGGGMYTLPAGVFHTSATEAETATVALGDGAPNRPQYALGEVSTADHRVTRQRCDPAETAALAGIVAEHLANSRLTASGHVGPGRDKLGGVVADSLVDSGVADRDHARPGQEDSCEPGKS